jgi:TRAP-type uncharacterized transport system substrate-binding protein
LLWTTPFGAWAKTKVFKIATGEYMGRYYPTGGAIAEIVNNRQEENGFRCIAEPTSGSVFNINAMMAGDMEFGIITKAVFENLGSLKYAHPTLNMLTRESMVKDGLTAPIHPGALRYYKEAGLK